MTAATLTAHLSAGVARVHGEPVYVMATDTLLNGVFAPQGRPEQDADWDAGIGAAAGMARRVNPVVTLTETDATAQGLLDRRTLSTDERLEPVSQRAYLEIRGTVYEIMALEPDGAGMVRVELLLAPDVG